MSSNELGFIWYSESVDVRVFTHATREVAKSTPHTGTKVIETVAGIFS